MKVLFILEAGIPEYRNFLLEGLAKEEQISDLLVLHSGRIYKGKGNYNSKKIRFIGNNKFGFYIGLWKYIRQYDIVVSSYNLRNISCWLPMFFKKDWILWGKGLGSNESAPIKLLRKLTAERGRLILVYNQFKKEEIVNTLGISEKKVISYNNTIHISNPGINNEIDKEYFLYFGRIQSRKGLIELIQEFGKYIKKNDTLKRLKLRFVGNGDYKEELQKEVDRLNLQDWVEFFPGVYDDISIKNHFVRAKAYISPYNVGLAIVNSFAYGVPVITCKSPQVGPEYHYLNDVNSFVIEDISMLNTKLQELSNKESKFTSESIFDYYINNLTSNRMYNEFYKAIKNLDNE